MKRRLAHQPMKTCRWHSSSSVNITITIIITGVIMDRAWSWSRREATTGGITTTTTTTTIITTIITASIAIEIAPAMMRKNRIHEVLFF